MILILIDHHISWSKFIIIHQSYWTISGPSPSIYIDGVSGTGAFYYDLYVCSKFEKEKYLAPNKEKEKKKKISPIILINRKQYTLGFSTTHINLIYIYICVCVCINGKYYILSLFIILAINTRTIYQLYIIIWNSNDLINSCHIRSVYVDCTYLIPC